MAHVASIYFYFCAAAINFAGTYYERAYMNDLPFFKLFGGRARFLTHWAQYSNLVFTVIAFIVSLQAKLRSKQKKRHTNSDDKDKLLEICNAYFHLISVPLSTAVPVLFWGLTLIDPVSILTPETRLLMPLASAINNYLHTFPFVYALVGLICLDDRQFKLKSVLWVIASIMLMYVGWIEWIQLKSGTGSVYPFLTHLAFFPSRILFYLFSYTFIIICYLVPTFACSRKDVKESKTKYRK